MMNKFADLHIHTNCSDGTLSPKETVEEAKKQGLDCIAITDHDTFEGVMEAVEEGKKCSLEVIAGVELSSELNDRDIHILGYFADYKNQSFTDALSKMQNSRIERMGRMIEKLKAFGIDNITLEEVCAMTNSDSVGRLHLANKLVEKKWAPDIKTVFNKYLSDDGPAYAPKFKQTPNEAIKLIKEVGGVAILAHPMVTRVDELIAGFASQGLDGLEVYYPNTTKNETEFYRKLAKKHNMIVTGGSDAHGISKNNTCIGKVKVPYEVIEELKKRL